MRLSLNLLSIGVVEGFVADAGGAGDDAGFVDYSGELVDEGITVEFFGVGDTDEGEASAAEEFFHVFGVTAGGMICCGAIVEFDGANWTESAFVAKDEIDSFIVDVAVSFAAVLAADFVVEEGGEIDLRDDVKTLTEDVV